MAQPKKSPVAVVKLQVGAGSKEAKAIELGRPILDEAGFKILLSDGPDAAKAHLGLN